MQLQNVEETMEYLTEREVKFGGYVQTTAIFTPQDELKKKIKVHVFIAKPNNPYWLGEASVSQIANQVSTYVNIFSVLMFDFYTNQNNL